MNKSSIAIILSVATLSIATPVAAQQAAGAPGSNATDQQFVTQAANANNQEIDEAKAELATTNDANVKSFANDMIKDHSTSLGQLAAIAKSINLKVPDSRVQTDNPGAPGETSTMGSPPPGANGPNPSAAMSGNAYMQKEVQDHQQVIALYDKEARLGDNPQLRTYAANALPVLKEHLALAQQYVASGKVGPDVTPTP
ncbi:MAG: DUF4142 domain-containing protein [Candidatus Eremiobacteraeota bacterium]|nr:DUF4142 domain-containing protein [Candidatus Eremiobacteraeota bacterium]